jgi:hypothetical protein
LDRLAEFDRFDFNSGASDHYETGAKQSIGPAGSAYEIERETSPALDLRRSRSRRAIISAMQLYESRSG